MKLIEKEISILLEKGYYKNKEELMDDACRALLRSRPHLKIDVATTLYERAEISLTKAAEIAGVCIEDFKEILKDKGLSMNVPSIPKEELLAPLEYGYKFPLQILNDSTVIIPTEGELSLYSIFIRSRTFWSY